MVNPDRFYTYAYLREDRTPYYIGKGTGRRAYRKERRVFPPPNDKSRIIKLKQNLTEEEAFKHEIYMIAVFGRKDLGTGILHNKTDGGDGSSGLKFTEEHKKKMSKRMSGEKNPFYGKKHSEETREQIRKSLLGKPFPGKSPDFKGTRWWNDGQKNKRALECPGKGWKLGQLSMANRKFTDKNNNEWNWQETPETIEALKQLHETVEAVNQKKFAGNYNGPLYAPHPDLKNEQ